jgi:hypothetical protein
MPPATTIDLVVLVKHVAVAVLPPAPALALALVPQADHPTTKNLS